MIEEVFRRAAEFDLVHFHTDYIHLPVACRMETPHVTTLHGRLDLPELAPLYRMFSDVPLISISDSQREPLRRANFVGTIHHGLPKNLYELDESPEPYLAFLGRVSPEKGLDRAIAIAKQTGRELRIAAKVDRKDQEYFETEIRSQLDDPLITFMDEVGDSEKQELLGKASAVLFPIDWPEPFGIVMIEAMACGTPVIAFRRGSVPEVIDEGVTGFIVESVEESVQAVGKLSTIDRRLCRKVFEQKFSSTRMAQDHGVLYRKLQDSKAQGITIEVRQ
jgi:glycosyltransferase involved in cell wall biosynthesis